MKMEISGRCGRDRRNKLPTYEYLCEGCDHKFEIMQKVTARKKRKCPQCGKPHLRRLFGVPGLIFKGSGFYVNDYPKESK